MGSQQVIALGLRHEALLPVQAETSEATSTQACAAVCPEWSMREQELDRERRDDLAAVMGVVHEAVAAFGAEVSSFHNELSESTGRFDALVSLDDPQTIKQRLIAEVQTLKSAAAARRDRWDATSRQHAERMARMEQQLKDTRVEASTDPLTGLVNRRAFDRHLRRRLETSRSQFVLGLLDVDDFKGINDTYGHAVGDQVLVTIAQSLKRAVRPGDVVARLGGDEFAVIAVNVTLRQAESRFKGVLAAIGEASMSQRVGDILVSAPPTVSCGIAEFTAGDTDKSLCERADTALYDAKRGGKSRVASRERAFTRDLMRGGGSRE